jgi:hypothetical protein
MDAVVFPALSPGCYADVICEGDFLHALTAEACSAEVVSRREAFKHFFPDCAWLSRAESVLTEASSEAAQRFHAQRYVLERMWIVVVGAIGREDVFEALEKVEAKIVAEKAPSSSEDSGSTSQGGQFYLSYDGGAIVLYSLKAPHA